LEGTVKEVEVITQHSNGVCPPGEHPLHGLAMVDLSSQISLSVSLAKEGFSIGKLQALYNC
jgi:hypothetical protein